MNSFPKALLIIATASLGSQLATAAEVISGAARVVDGDTLKIGSEVIRLHGIDAPENGQDCRRKNGKSYNCGASAENHLQALITGEVRCTGSQRDGYRRLIAVCSSGDTVINRAMVLSGWSLAYRKFSTDYVDQEEEAKSQQRGLWSGDFVPPWQYRSNKWTAAVEAAPDSNCPIKGNINSKGDRIYHAPWSRSYKRTRINTSKGEKWFCSEEEALAAGWRAPLR